MTTSAEVWALFTKQSGGVDTLWIFRSGASPQSFPLERPTISGANNNYGAGYPWYQLAPMTDGRLGLYWMSKATGQNVQINVLPLTISGDLLEQGAIESWLTNITTGTPYFWILKDFVIVTDPNDNAGNLPYQVLTKDLAHIRDGHLNTDVGVAISGGAMGVCKNTIYFAIVDLSNGYGVKFASDASTTAFPITPPAGGWDNTVGTLTPDQASRNFRLNFVNAGIGGGNQIMAYPTEHVILVGTSYNVGGGNASVQRTVNVMDDSGNWGQAVMPFQGYGYDADFDGYFVAGELVEVAGDYEMRVWYEENSGDAQFHHQSYAGKVSVPSTISGYTDLGEFTVVGSDIRETIVEPPNGPSPTGGGFGGIWPFFGRLTVSDSTWRRKVTMWHTDVALWDQTALEDVEITVDISSEPFTLIPFLLSVPSANNAHHGVSVAKVTVDGSTDPVEIKFRGLGVPLEKSVYTQNFAADPGWNYFDDSAGAAYTHDYQTGLTTPPGITTALRMQQVSTDLSQRAPSVQSPNPFTTPVFTLATPGRTEFWMNYDNPNGVDGVFTVIFQNIDSNPDSQMLFFSGRSVPSGGTYHPNVTQAGWQKYSVDLVAGRYALVFEDATSWGSNYVGPSSIQITGIQAYEAAKSPWYPIPLDRKSVSFQTQIGSEDGPLWAQPYADWGVLDSTQPDSTQVVGSDPVGPIYIFGDTPSWTQIDITDIDIPTDAQVWRPRLLVLGQDPTIGPGRPAAGADIYVDCIYVPENGLSVADQPYLDGDQPYGIWEGTPRAATSLLRGVSDPPPDVFDDTVVVGDGLVV